MGEAKVSELRARLSEFLAGVRAGGTVTVYDRATAIGRVRLTRPVLHRAALPMPTVVKTLGAFHLATAHPRHPRPAAGDGRARARVRVHRSVTMSVSRPLFPQMARAPHRGPGVPRRGETLMSSRRWGTIRRAREPARSSVDLR